MSAIFLLPVCLTYWPRKYTTRVDPRVDNSHHVRSWSDHTLPSYSVFVCRYGTWPCDLDLWTLNSCHTWRVTWPTLPPSMNTLSLSVLQLWVITFSVGYHWKCVRGHCACAESRDPWVGGQKITFLECLTPDLSIHYTTYIGLRRRLTVVYSRGSPMLKPLTAKISCAWPYDLWPFDLKQLSYMAGHVTNPAIKFEDRMWLFVRELRVITVPIDYHWKCVRGHCACAESRNPSVGGGQKRLHFWNYRPRFAYSL